MLSRARLLTTQQSNGLLALAARFTATTPANFQSQGANLPEYRRPVRQEPGKVRMGFLPDEWFTFFYKRTGVTGPYVFGATFITYLCSKEWYVMDHEYYNGISLAILCVFAVKKLGPPLAKFLDKEIDAVEDEYKNDRKAQEQEFIDGIDNEKENQWRAEGQKMLVAAKRSNVQMQLEAAYRERLFNVYTDVKRRLDFQLRKVQVEQRIAQRNMVDWVVRQVQTAITPAQDRKTIDMCIAQLAAMNK